ncbi:hypothetical protein EZV73_00080 [Acidaminobacter sp. JC074]|uniref:hypothetical protein n=1 Tax=Acidaminobacter sp. JC074 TaxID=2530199 RepID=UPI001F0E81CD|nr:hypothetical protein [Acidaminobacter sp. JC074]MCH4885935.1 hypothetical protein [Acidaminobacter sp. JC074]
MNENKNRFKEVVAMASIMVIGLSIIRIVFSLITNKHLLLDGGFASLAISLGIVIGSFYRSKYVNYKICNDQYYKDMLNSKNIVKESTDKMDRLYRIKNRYSILRIEFVVLTEDIDKVVIRGPKSLKGVFEEFNILTIPFSGSR